MIPVRLRLQFCRSQVSLSVPFVGCWGLLLFLVCSTNALHMSWAADCNGNGVEDALDIAPDFRGFETHGERIRVGDRP